MYLFFVLFCLFFLVLPACMSEYYMYTYMFGASGSQKMASDPQKQGYRQVYASRWVLKIEHRSSWGVAHAFNHGVISLGLFSDNLMKWFKEVQKILSMDYENNQKKLNAILPQQLINIIAFKIYPNMEDIFNLVSSLDFPTFFYLFQVRLMWWSIISSN